MDGSSNFKVFMRLTTDSSKEAVNLEEMVKVYATNTSLYYIKQSYWDKFKVYIETLNLDVDTVDMDIYTKCIYLIPDYGKDFAIFVQLLYTQISPTYSVEDMLRTVAQHNEYIYFILDSLAAKVRESNKAILSEQMAKQYGTTIQSLKEQLEKCQGALKEAVEKNKNYSEVVRHLKDNLLDCQSKLSKAENENKACKEAVERATIRIKEDMNSLQISNTRNLEYSEKLKEVVEENKCLKAQIAKLQKQPSTYPKPWRDLKNVPIYKSHREVSENLIPANTCHFLQIESQGAINTNSSLSDMNKCFIKEHYLKIVEFVAVKMPYLITYIRAYLKQQEREVEKNENNEATKK